MNFKSNIKQLSCATQDKANNIANVDHTYDSLVTNSRNRQDLVDIERVPVGQMRDEPYIPRRMMLPPLQRKTQRIGPIQSEDSVTCFGNHGSNHEQTRYNYPNPESSCYDRHQLGEVITQNQGGLRCYDKLQQVNEMTTRGRMNSVAQQKLDDVESVHSDFSDHYDLKKRQRAWTSRVNTYGREPPLPDLSPQIERHQISSLPRGPKLGILKRQEPHGQFNNNDQQHRESVACQENGEMQMRYRDVKVRSLPERDRWMLPIIRQELGAPCSVNGDDNDFLLSVKPVKPAANSVRRRLPNPPTKEMVIEEQPKERYDGGNSHIQQQAVTYVPVRKNAGWSENNYDCAYSTKKSERQTCRESRRKGNDPSSSDEDDIRDRRWQKSSVSNNREKGNRRNRDVSDQSSNDEVNHTRISQRKNNKWIKPEKVDGKGSWETFLLQFQNCA